MINTVYYTGRSDSDLKHLTAVHGGATWPAASTDIRWPSHYRFLYYDDDDMMKSMAQLDPLLEAEGVSGTLKAFRALRPGAFKADVWRYAILWACGGIYVDGKMRLAQDWDAFLRKEMTLGKYTFDDGNDHLISCIDRWVTRLDRNQTIKGVWQGLLVSTPRHPDLLRVLRHVVDNVVHRRYFPDEGKLEMLYVTGPAAFARATQTAGSGWKAGSTCRAIWGTRSSVADDLGLGSVLFVQDAKLHEGLQAVRTERLPGPRRSTHERTDNMPCSFLKGRRLVRPAERRASLRYGPRRRHGSGARGRVPADGRPRGATLVEPSPGTAATRRVGERRGRQPRRSSRRERRGRRAPAGAGAAANSATGEAAAWAGGRRGLPAGRLHHGLGTGSVAASAGAATGAGGSAESARFTRSPRPP